jgi:hypothetical protein
MERAGHDAVGERPDAGVSSDCGRVKQKAPNPCSERCVGGIGGDARSAFARLEDDRLQLHPGVCRDSRTGSRDMGIPGTTRLCGSFPPHRGIPEPSGRPETACTI